MNTFVVMTIIDLVGTHVLELFWRCLIDRVYHIPVSSKCLQSWNHNQDYHWCYIINWCYIITGYLHIVFKNVRKSSLSSYSLQNITLNMVIIELTSCSQSSALNQVLLMVQPWIQRYSIVNTRHFIHGMQEKYVTHCHGDLILKEGPKSPSLPQSSNHSTCIIAQMGDKLHGKLPNPGFPCVQCVARTDVFWGPIVTRDVVAPWTSSTQLQVLSFGFPSGTRWQPPWVWRGRG